MSEKEAVVVYIHSFSCQQHGVVGTVEGYFISTSPQVKAEEFFAALEAVGYDTDLIPGGVSAEWRIKMTGDANSQATRRDLWSRVLQAWEDRHALGRIIRQELKKKGSVRNILCISY